MADFPDIPRYSSDLDIHFTLKSQDRIKYWADALIFIFFREADNQGVTNELTFTCLKVLEKVHFTVVFNEKGLKLSSLTKGPIKIHEIKSDEFKDDTELCERAIGYCTNFVHRLYWHLQ